MFNKQYKNQMKQSTIYWIGGIVVAVLVIGYFAGWFSKKATTGTNGTTTATV